MNKTTVIHHSADFDGIFCREIARKFLPDAKLIGWDFGDSPLAFPDEGTVYVLDLPVDRVFGGTASAGTVHAKDGSVLPLSRVIWIDHHQSSIASHPTNIPGYRIDGVAACRLAWQWFCPDPRPCTCEVPHSEGHYDYCNRGRLPAKPEFVARRVIEPLAVRWVGEYDVWDKRDPDAETFQFGLRSETELDWIVLLELDRGHYLDRLLRNGRVLQRYQQQTDASIVQHRSFLLEWEGLTFLALTTARCNSLTFAALDVPETGHDALMGFYRTSKGWTVSLYHARHRTDLDLSQIAVKYGGGGHRGACGFQAAQLPFA